MTLSGIEEEVVLLWATCQLIDSMVNFEVLSSVGNDPDSSIRFESVTHQRFFNIALVDFLSDTDRRVPVKHTSYMQALRAIATNPHFDVCGSVAPLRAAVGDFTSWLGQEVTVDTWLPSLDRRVALRMPRSTFLRICGNISKHNVLRLGQVAEELQRLLAANGLVCGLEDALLALDDFYQRFHTDLLNYHSSTIAESLNNIRWGMYEYLRPEYERSIVWEAGDRVRYSFRYPSGIGSPFAKVCYWDLMNEVREPPYMRRFVVSRYLKMQY